MILFGLFYLLSPLIIPAYIQAKSIPYPEFTIDYPMLFLSFILMASLIGIGFLIDRHKRVKRKGGKKWTHLLA